MVKLFSFPRCYLKGFISLYVICGIFFPISILNGLVFRTLLILFRFTVCVYCKCRIFTLFSFETCERTHKRQFQNHHNGMLYFFIGFYFKLDTFFSFFCCLRLFHAFHFHFFVFRSRICVKIWIKKNSRRTTMYSQKRNLDNLNINVI